MCSETKRNGTYATMAVRWAAGMQRTRVAVLVSCALLCTITDGRAADGVGQTPANPIKAVPAAVAVAPDAAVAPVVPSVPVVPSAPVVAAKVLFGAMKTAAGLEARAIGSYAKGCLSGAQALPMDGPQWQAMRGSRNRNWGHPALLSFLERFSQDVRRLDGFPGLLVGDMSQPRGGPMQSSHASHQIGLDVDIWFTPMPSRRLTTLERESVSATNVLDATRLEIDPKVFTPDHILLLKRAASFGEVERVFIHPAIKKQLCEATINDPDRTWLSKMRPMWGHDDHFHVRLRCPDGVAGCQPQVSPPGDDGCGKELVDWFALLTAPPKPSQPAAKPITLDNLPADCRTVLSAAQSPQSTLSPRVK